MTTPKDRPGMRGNQYTTLQIGILDAMGRGNLGDAAIQESVISNIRGRQQNARFVGFSFDPEDTFKRHGIPAHPLTRGSRRNAHITEQGSDRRNIKSTLKAAFSKVPVLYFFLRFLAAIVRETMFLVRSYRILRKLDLLVISGGGQICELWGGPWHVYTLFKFSILVKIAGKRIYFLNVGAEPLNHWLTRFFAKSSIRLADYVSFRDAYSQSVVRGLGLKAKTDVCADPAYALEVSNYLNGNSGELMTQTVGINPLAFCDPRIWPRKDQSVYDVYLEKLTRFSLWLRQEGYNLKFFTTSANVDKYAVSDLKQKLAKNSQSGHLDERTFGRYSEAVQELYCDSVTEVLVEMSGCDYIVTSRYHGVIFSHLLGKPLIVLNYQAKSDVAMRAAGLGEYSADIEYFDPNWLIHAFSSLVHNCEIIKTKEERTVKVYMEKLREQFDALFSHVT